MSAREQSGPSGRHRGMRKLALVPTLAFALAAAACGGGSTPAGLPAATTGAAPSAGTPIPGGGLSVEEALASTLSGPLMIAGQLVAAGDEVRLCSALLESYPPQCGGASLLVLGLDLASVEGLQTAGGVTWTEGRVSLLGEVEDGVLTVSTTSR